MQYCLNFPPPGGVNIADYIYCILTFLVHIHYQTSDTMTSIFLFGVMTVAVLMSIVINCNGLEVGKTANSDPNCAARFGQKVCTLELFPVCAKLDGKIIRGPNTSCFCTEYGNKAAEILAIGFTNLPECKSS